tara:strand:+ start:135 stop:476 length:342 start_codon:yes stop_codon:yes gene_type:complete
MICEKKQKIILDEIYRECLLCRKGISKNDALKLAGLKYSNMLKAEKERIYNRFVEKTIIKYLIESIENSLCFYIPNSHPEKRVFRIKEWAVNKARNMSTLEKAAICEKLNIQL